MSPVSSSPARGDPLAVMKHGLLAGGRIGIYLFSPFFLNFCDRKTSFSSLIYHLKDLANQNGSKKGLSGTFITDYLYL